MALIKTQLVLTDGMSAKLRSINDAVNLVCNSLRNMDAVGDSAATDASFQSVSIEVSRTNTELEEAEKNTRDVGSAASGLESKFSRLAGIVASAFSVKKLVDLSDNVTMSSARLSLLVDDEGSVDALKQQIYGAAQEARTSYVETMSNVASFGLLAGKAFEDASGKVNTDELIKFSTLLNKNFIVAGATAQEQASAMLQLKQAMGAGRLQGEEYRTIIESAPLLARSIEDYMRNVKGAKGTLKEWASEGLLTSEVIKAATFASAEDIEERFKKIPLTWHQVWTMATNKFTVVMQPLLNGISWLAQNWTVLEPIVVGLATAIGILAGAVALYNAQQKISAFWALITAAHEAIKGGATVAAAAATKTAEGAQIGYNAALLACPLTWVLLIIIAVIAAIYAIVAAVNKVTGKTISATGLIFGTVSWLVSVIINIVIGLLNGLIQLVYTLFIEPFTGIIEWILNVCQGGFDSFGGAVANLIGQIIGWFLSLGQVVTRIIDAIFGTNWTSGLESLKGKVIAWGKTENSVTLDRIGSTELIKRVDNTDWFNAGYKMGQGFDEKVGGMFDTSGALDGIADDTSSIADNTKTTKEDLKYLRDIAEQEAINRFTTAEVKIDMTGMTNRIDSNMDLDGVINALTSGFAEALEVAAEGVHI